MFRRLIFSKSRSNGMLTSKLFCDKSFYSAFINDLKHTQDEVLIESPFIANNRTSSMLPIFKRLVKKGVKVRINTRNPRHHDKELRIQAWQSIRRLRDAGVKVKFYDDMRHRKLAILDREVLWEGSLNIMSQSYSKEIMRRTKSKELAVQMIRFTAINTWGL
ncbi:MAG TPA: phospholipase D-like domain-containing protein [Candidatus Dormibacteraeota bacterium]|nr:phospholipase D-like domain-containing protein [Candidatus Dormibacteraeota bacterium]